MKLGIKLLSYKGQVFDLWVHEDGERLEAETREELDHILREYRARNPEGNYLIMAIDE